MSEEFTEERRARIADAVRTRGRVRLAELVALTGVSEPTIRKDLTELERQRLLRRTRGGAIGVEVHGEITLADRQPLNAEAKARIARACRALVGRGDSVYVDSGTTAEAIASVLDVPDLNVLTNAVRVAEIIATRGIARHTLVGGQLRLLGGSLVGPVAIDTLRRFTVNVAFIGVSGVEADGISAADVSEGQLKQEVIEIAKRVVVPADASKIGQTDFYRIAGLGSVDTLVTDAPNDHLASWCQAYGTELVLAG